MCVFTTVCVYAQEIPEGFIPSDFNLPKNNFGYQNTPLKLLGSTLKSLKDVICDGGECKERSYVKIEFSDDGMFFKVKGKIWKSSFKEKKYFRIIPKGKDYHASTGKVATSIVYNKYGKAVPESFYHLTYPKGNDHVIQKINNNGVIIQRMVYNKDGSLAMNYQVPFNSMYEDSVKCKIKRCTLLYKCK